MKKLGIGLVIILILAAIGWLLLSYRHPQSTPLSDDANKSVPPAKVKPTHVDSVLAGMSLRDKVASLFVANAPGTDPQSLGQFMDTYKLGGFILMGENIPSNDTALKAETAALRGNDMKLPRLVSTDQEGGVVRRLPGDTFASAETLKSLPVSATTQAFSDRSALVRSVGITLNFGIIADTTSDPNSFIYERVLGTTPQSAADRVTAAVDASKQKTLSTIKHFPGHGETETDSHKIIPTTPLSLADWRSRDMLPFKAGIDAGSDVVMVGHLRYASVDSQPASLSRKWHDILRDELNYKGVIITDAMGMLQDSGEPTYADPVRNAVTALRAGNTMLLYVFDDTTRIDPNELIDGVTAAVQNGQINASVIDRDARLALDLRAETAAFVTE